jgi:aryl-alcohol dehydrogenase-like predicted oxidoreductase
MAALRDAGLTRRLGVAPGPANGFTLDLLDCFERFGALLDWAMIILNPLEPWPGELVLEAAGHHDVQLITRVVDYGGLFHDDVLPGHPFPKWDHRSFRPAGWIEAGRGKLDRMRPIAERHGLSLLQLSCLWNLAHGPVRCDAQGRRARPRGGAAPGPLGADAGARRRRRPLGHRARPRPPAGLTWTRCAASS